MMMVFGGFRQGI